ncbi:MAG: hypothetical protein GY719_16850 [bacterium]|nr:hypothetical protein [bacterium]
MAEKPPPRKKFRRAPLIAIAALAVVFIGTNVLLRSGTGPDPSIAPPRAETAEPSEIEEVAGSLSPELDVPVTFDTGSTDAVLGLEVRKARLANYPDGSSFLTVNAVLTNLGDTELDKLGMRLEHLDESGTVVLSDAFEGLNNASPVTRPRDVFPLHLLKKSRDTVREARLVVEIVDLNPGAPSYEQAREIELRWQIEQPAGLEITVRERGYRFSEKSFAEDDSGYFDAVLEIENAGDRTIRALELAAVISGPGDSWTTVDENHVVLVSGPSLRPGEVWVERFIEEVEGRPEGYRVSVIAVQ